jgi:hypothetical protein
MLHLLSLNIVGYKMDIMTQSIFETIYDKYAGSLYAIALEICPDVSCAEHVFIKTFKNIYDQNRTCQNSPTYYVELIKLILSIAKAEVYLHKKDINFTLKQFENTPLLQRLICNDESLENYCSLNNISKQDGLQIMRKEFSTLKNTKVNYSNRSVMA